MSREYRGLVRGVFFLINLDYVKEPIPADTVAVRILIGEKYIQGIMEAGIFEVFTPKSMDVADIAFQSHPEWKSNREWGERVPIMLLFFREGKSLTVYVKQSELEEIMKIFPQC